MQKFLPDLDARKAVMRALAVKNPMWKIRKALFFWLMVISVVVIAAQLWFVTTYPTTGDVLFVVSLLGSAIAFVSFVGGISLRSTAKYACAFPYSAYANGALLLHDNYLEYTYWEVGKDSAAAYSRCGVVYDDENKTTYSIMRDSITGISTTEDGLVLRVVGPGILEVPYWKCEDSYALSDKVRSISEFSFPLAFSEKNVEEIILNWRNRT